MSSGTPGVQAAADRPARRPPRTWLRSPALRRLPLRRLPLRRLPLRRLPLRRLPLRRLPLCRLVLLRGVLVPLALVASLSAVPAAAQVRPQAPVRVQTTAAPPVTVLVSDLRPRAPRPGGDLQVLGALVNTGADRLRDLQVRVRVGGRLITRGQLAQADAAAPVTFPRRDVPLDRDLAPGQRVELDLRVRVDDLRLGADGVYPLQLEVRGVRATSEVPVVLGSVGTALPWFGDREVDPLRIAWVWPLVDEPRRSPGEDLLDDRLAEHLAPGGRLGRSLRAGRAGETGQCPAGAQAASGRRAARRDPEPERCSPVEVTWVVDPDLLHTVEGMTRDYTVLTRDGPRPGSGTPQATAWLQSLRETARGADVVALPYADPDVVALTRGPAGLAADVAAARGYGATVTRDVLGAEPLQTVAVPPAGRLTDAALDALTAGSTRALVLADDTVPPAPPGRSTPGARVELPRSTTSGRLTGLVADRGLTDLLLPERRREAGARLAEQRWLVETAMIAAELPARGRTLVVALPRRADVDPALLGAAVTDSGAVPWMCAVPLADVVAARERCPQGRLPSYEPERSVELLQPEPGAPALDPRLLERVAEARAGAVQLTGAVIRGGTSQSQAVRARMQRAWLRAESSAWRDDRRRGTRLARLLDQDVTGMRRKVQVLTGRVTLTSANGRVSVAVVNELEQPVTVAVRLVPPSQARLSQTQTDPIEVPARTSLPVSVQAQTQTSGRFVVRAQLLDREGVPFGEPSELVVNSTRYGTAALAVTGVAAAVLFVAAGVRIARRARGRTGRAGEPTPEVQR